MTPQTQAEQHAHAMHQAFLLKRLCKGGYVFNGNIAGVAFTADTKAHYDTTKAVIAKMTQNHKGTFGKLQNMATTNAHAIAVNSHHSIYNDGMKFYAEQIAHACHKLSKNQLKAVDGLFTAYFDDDLTVFLDNLNSVKAQNYITEKGLSFFLVALIRPLPELINSIVFAYNGGVTPKEQKANEKLAKTIIDKCQALQHCLL